jgi:membrane protease YdiL (CAAX protease family)
MFIYIEAIILYLVLFFSWQIGMPAGGEQESYSAARELTRIFLFYIPSIALIWYLLSRVKNIKDWNIIPGKKDLISGLITFPCLLITGIVIAFVSTYIAGAPEQTRIHSPSTVFEWITLCVFCIIAAYLEESFFRFYLLGRRKELRLKASWALVLSVALFSICHIYEGPWGFLNAILAGIILAFMFLRYKSLHGIAIAHGMYNIAVYVINSLLTKN